MATRTWADVMTAVLVGKDGSNLDRYERAGGTRRWCPC